MSKTHRFLNVAGPMLLLGLIGCETVNTSQRRIPRADSQTVDERQIVTDPELADRVRVLGIREATVGGDLLKIQANVVNTTNQRHRFGYRFTWFDNQGMLVESPTSGWQQRTIEGKEPLSLVGVAPRPNVVDFRLKLIQADN